jgi:hypothetical protein
VAVLDDLAAVAARAPRAAFAGSQTTLAPTIPDDAARRAAGARIGSGGVKKGVDVVVNRRLNGRRGMRSWRERAEGLVALRLALLNDAWDHLIPPALTPQHLPAFRCILRQVRSDRARWAARTYSGMQKVCRPEERGTSSFVTGTPTNEMPRCGSA